MICNLDSPEKLYLSKGDQNIYIDSCKLPQLHIDGIRFLYKQYNKQKSGVIINHKPECGSNVQIILLIKAIRCLLKKPVLVLCKEGTEHSWMEQFQRWTDFCDEVVLEMQKPFIKKLVLINAMSNLPAFSRHEWSLIVVHDDESSNTVLKHSFRADFKIYITSTDMKTDLDKFNQIYEWLYPGEAKEKNKWKFNKSDFTTDSNNPLDVVEKAILLDAFMEDIVMTSEETDTLIEDHNPQGSVTDLYPAITISKKNKDATGTKIKRSKRKIYDDDDDNDIPLRKTIKDSADSPKESIKIAIAAKCSEDNNTLPVSINNGGTQDFSKESFKIERNVQEDLSLRKKSEMPDINMDTLNSQSQLDLVYESDSVTEINSDKYYEMDTLEFSNDSCENRVTKVNDPIQVNNNDLDENGERKEISLEADDETTDDIVTKTENDIQNEISSDVDFFHVSNKISEKIISVKCPSVDNNIKSNIKDIESNLELEDSQSICNGINVNDNEIEISKESLTNEMYTKNILCKNKLDISNDVITDRESNDIIESSQNELHKNGIGVPSEVVAPVANLEHRCIEDKIKDMEEKALKKFKGSILDKLF